MLVNPLPYQPHYIKKTKNKEAAAPQEDPQKLKEEATSFIRQAIRNFFDVPYGRDD